MAKVLITGITGFAGSFLAEELVPQGEEVHGTIRPGANPDNINHIKDKLRLHEIDLLNKEAVVSLIENLKPAIIYHLAALTSPAESFKNPEQTFINNISGEIAILEAAKTLQECRVIIISSAEVYGLVEFHNLPVDEETPLRPASPYAVSKIAQDFLALQYFLTHKLNVVRVRPFNHVGPRQAPFFVTAAFAKQIAEIERGVISPVIKVGNLEAKRDFTDVRDMVKAYKLITEKGVAGEVYNIGSGVSHKVSEILDILRKLSTKEISVEVDPERLRPSDVPDIVCDNTRIFEATGWKASISFEQSITDILDYWRGIL